MTRIARPLGTLPPGHGPQHEIPIRTFAEWDEARPGFCEVDLVAHDGGDAFGDFCQTLDLVAQKADVINP